MRIAYLDVFAGISGDMTLAALVDAGAPLEAIRAELSKIPMHGWTLEAVRTTKSGLAGTQVHVRLAGDHGHDHGHGRSAGELMDLITRSELEPPVKSTATAILSRIAEAEARVHNTIPDQVHFHELGGIDSIVDIVGAVVGFRLLGVERIVCSPLPVSHGTVDTAHGRLPLPAPATAELLRGVPTHGLDVEGETVTPTGAALAVGLAAEFGFFPSMVVRSVGYGLGHATFPGVPNALRLFVGEREGPMPGIEGGSGQWEGLVTDRIKVVEANLDDMSPELFPVVVQQTFAAGAADVWMAPIYMKKGRPATQLCAVVPADRLEAVVAAILRESTTLGVRISDWERRCLPREIITVPTPYGSIAVKVAKLGGQVLTAAPEHSDCAAAAQKHGVPVKQVYAAAIAAARRLGEESGSSAAP